MTPLFCSECGTCVGMLKHDASSNGYFICGFCYVSLCNVAEAVVLVAGKTAADACVSANNYHNATKGNQEAYQRAVRLAAVSRGFKELSLQRTKFLLDKL